MGCKGAVPDMGQAVSVTIVPESDRHTPTGDGDCLRLARRDEMLAGRPVLSLPKDQRSRCHRWTAAPDHPKYMPRPRR